MGFDGQRAAFHILFPFMYLMQFIVCLQYKCTQVIDIGCFAFFRKKTSACHTVYGESSTVMNQCVFRGMEENKER